MQQEIYTDSTVSNWFDIKLMQQNCTAEFEGGNNLSLFGLQTNDKIILWDLQEQEKRGKGGLVFLNIVLAAEMGLDSELPYWTETPESLGAGRKERSWVRGSALLTPTLQDPTGEPLKSRCCASPGLHSPCKDRDDQSVSSVTRMRITHVFLSIYKY